MPEGDTGVIGISGCIGEVMALPLFILLFQSEYLIPLHPRLAQSAKPPPSASNPGALPGSASACSHNTTQQAPPILSSPRTPHQTHKYPPHHLKTTHASSST